MSRVTAIDPGRCLGCLLCALACSAANHGEFNPARSFVSVTRDEFAGTFVISFSSLCRNCRKCASACPSGALQAVEAAEREVPSGHAPAKTG